MKRKGKGRWEIREGEKGRIEGKGKKELSRQKGEL